MESPEKHPPVLSTRFVGSALFQIPLFHRTHVSALNFCMSLFRHSGFAIIIQPRRASRLDALTRALTKESAANPEARYSPPIS
jgi:hypothetical protein